MGSKIKEIIEFPDRKIWEQYGKVTGYCNKEFGWNKYDLVRKAMTVTNLGMIGFGSCGAIFGAEIGSSLTIGAGGLIATLQLPIYYSDKKQSIEEEKKEYKIMEKTGAVKKPVFRPTLPIFLGVSLWSIESGIDSLVNGTKVPEKLSSVFSSEEYGVIDGLLALTIGTALLGMVSKKYFQDQIMTPPKKKQGFWKTIYDKIRGKTEVPQLEPASEQEYQSLEDLAA